MDGYQLIKYATENKASVECVFIKYGSSCIYMNSGDLIVVSNCEVN